MAKIALERFSGMTLAQRSRVWANLSDEDRRLEAAKAINERDHDKLWSLSEAYLANHGEGGTKTSIHTLKAHKKSISLLLEAWQGENLLRPSRNAGVMWVRSLEDEGKSPATVRVRLAGAKLLYKALKWSGVSEAVPFDDVRAVRDKTAPWDKRQPYSQEDLEKLIRGAKPVDRVMVLLGAHAGLRISEMCALEWAEVNLETKSIVVKKGKGGKKRRVTMSDSLRDALRELGGSTGKVLPFGIYRARERLQNLCKRCGVEYKSVHSLRHYSGTRLTKEHGGNLLPAAEHLGHSSLDTARIYGKWASDELKKSVGNW
jgi:integrase